MTPSPTTRSRRIMTIGAISGAAVGSILVGGPLGMAIGGVTVALVARNAIKSYRSVDRRQPATVY